jgi:hypothetical protein
MPGRIDEEQQVVLELSKLTLFDLQDRLAEVEKQLVSPVEPAEQQRLQQRQRQLQEAVVLHNDTVEAKQANLKNFVGMLASGGVWGICILILLVIGAPILWPLYLIAAALGLGGSVFAALIKQQQK